MDFLFIEKENLFKRKNCPYFFLAESLNIFKGYFINWFYEYIHKTPLFINSPGFTNILSHLLDLEVEKRVVGVLFDFIGCNSL